MASAIKIDSALERNGVFRAAWNLMISTPTGKRTVDILATDVYKTEILPGTTTGSIAKALGSFRMGVTKTNRQNRLTTTKIEMDLLTPLLLEDMKGRINLEPPHTLTSILASILHHELLHAVGRGSETVDSRLDYYQNRGELAEPLWRSHDPGQSEFLRELKFIMPKPANDSVYNKSLRKSYDKILEEAHKPFEPIKPLVKY